MLFEYLIRQGFNLAGCFVTLWHSV